MMRARGALLLALTVLAPPRPASAEETVAEPSEAERLVLLAIAAGDEGSVAHLGERLGSAGIAACLGDGSRSVRILCAEAARHVERRWAVLAALAPALLAHEREVAARAAESMVAVLSGLEPEDLGAEEATAAEVETLLEALARATGAAGLSPDVRALAVVAAGALARLSGSALDVARAALPGSEPAVRRAAVAALVGSTEPEDLSALAAVAADPSDQLAAALAAAGLCEAAGALGRPMHEAAEARIRALLADPRARPSLLGPVLACIARSPAGALAELRAAAARHPNAGSRALYQSLARR